MAREAEEAQGDDEEAPCPLPPVAATANDCDRPSPDLAKRNTGTAVVAGDMVVIVPEQSKPPQQEATGNTSVRACIHWSVKQKGKVSTAAIVKQSSHNEIEAKKNTQNKRAGEIFSKTAPINGEQQ